MQTLVAAGAEIHCLRDPTRGGLATTLNEIAASSQVGVALEEGRVPVREEVQGVCEMLGLDPLYSACEGRLVVVVGEQAVEPILAQMQTHLLGRDAALIGRVVGEHPGRVLLHTTLGTTRVVEALSGA